MEYGMCSLWCVWSDSFTSLVWVYYVCALAELRAGSPSALCVYVYMYICMCIHIYSIWYAVRDMYIYIYIFMFTHVYIYMSHATYIQCIYIERESIWHITYLKLQVSFAECRLFYRALLQKRPIILRSLLNSMWYVRHDLFSSVAWLYHICAHAAPRAGSQSALCVYVYMYICTYIHIHSICMIFSMWYVWHDLFALLRDCIQRAHLLHFVHTATHCNTLQHTATHCNTLQHTATHCNTLQHTATHCNTLQHVSSVRPCSTSLRAGGASALYI